jgi:hypothetical protein
MVDVAFLPAKADASPPVVTSTETRRSTSSAAKGASRSLCPRAQRYSIVTLRPSV